MVSNHMRNRAWQWMTIPRKVQNLSIMHHTTFKLPNVRSARAQQVTEKVYSLQISTIYRVEGVVYLFFKLVSLWLSGSPNESISKLDTYHITQVEEVRKKLKYVDHMLSKEKFSMLLEWTKKTSFVAIENFIYCHHSTTFLSGCHVLHNAPSLT